MSRTNKILTGLIATFMIFVIFFDGITSYIHKVDEQILDRAFDHILMGADSALIEADKVIEEVNHLKEVEHRTKLDLDSILSKSKEEYQRLKTTQYTLYQVNSSVHYEKYKADSLNKIIDSLRKVIKYRPDSLRYNFIYIDSCIVTYEYDTIKIFVEDTIKYKSSWFKNKFN